MNNAEAIGLGYFYQKLNDAVQLNETSCLPRMNPFQYDTEHRTGRKETKKRTRKQNIKETDGEDADI